MHRIDTPTAQVDKFGAGKNGFTGGNPQTGELATALDADFFDSLQEEIAAVIEAAGITLDKSSNKQLLTSIQKLVSSGRLIGVRVITSSSIYTPTAGTKKIIVEVQGGGGAGGGSTATTSGNASLGAGGTEGCYAKSQFTSLANSYSVVVGIGGKGVSGNSGGGGGTTSFGDLVTAGGGYGGAVLPSGTSGLIVGSDGASLPGVPTVSGANIESSNFTASYTIGTRLSATLQGSAMAGAGGRSKFGGGGGNHSTNGAGTSGFSYGSGGAGAKSYSGTSNDTAYVGGNGMDGVVIVWEYA